MTAAAKSRLLTIPEVAARLRVSRRSAYRLARDLGEPITEDVLERYIASRLRGPVEGRHPLAQRIADHASEVRAALPRCCVHSSITYFVQGGDLIKIGQSRTERLDTRLAHLQCQSPIALVLIALAWGGDLESDLHRHLAAFRAHGEWFDTVAVHRFLLDRPPCIRCSFLGATR